MDVSRAGDFVSQQAEVPVETFVERLVGVATRGLNSAFRSLPGDEFPQTMRGRETAAGWQLHAEGRSDRYTAIALLGINRLAIDQQQEVFDGRLARDLVPALTSRVQQSREPGALALTLWAQSELEGAPRAATLSAVHQLLRSERALPTVDVSWMLTAATLAFKDPAARDIARLAEQRLLGEQGRSGLFPHALPAITQTWYRRHIGCFADQIYPIQALARYQNASGVARSLVAADRCAQVICDLQGDQGEWWWFYDHRDGTVVEPFPVYSVHQHAMAPMALADLRRAGGKDHFTALGRGLRWLERPLVSDASMVEDDLGVIWRNVGRRDAKKASRALQAVTTAVRPRLHVPALDALMPANRVDHECRPYELGWLLYAWLPHPDDESGGEQ